jgi:hypothetical protein
MTETPLTDFLATLADPSKLDRFRNDPARDGRSVSGFDRLTGTWAYRGDPAARRAGIGARGYGPLNQR